MLFSSEIDQLLETEMDRREFLAYAGSALLAIVGISGLLKLLTQPLQPHFSSPRSKGYGGGSYGGG